MWRKLKIELPYDPAISLLDTYWKKTKSLMWKDKQQYSLQHYLQEPRYGKNLSMWWVDKKDVVYTFNGILLSHFIKWYLAIYDNMDRPRGYHLSEVNQTKTNTVWFHIHVESKNQNKAEADLKRKTGGCRRGGRLGVGQIRDRIERYKPPIIK